MPARGPGCAGDRPPVGPPRRATEWTASDRPIAQIFELVPERGGNVSDTGPSLAQVLQCCLTSDAAGQCQCRWRQALVCLVGPGPVP
jgi:hypothetical protein